MITNPKNKYHRSAYSYKTNFIENRTTGKQLLRIKITILLDTDTVPNQWTYEPYCDYSAQFTDYSEYSDLVCDNDGEIFADLFLFAENAYDAAEGLEYLLNVGFPRPYTREFLQNTNSNHVLVGGGHVELIGGPGPDCNSDLWWNTTTNIEFTEADFEHYLCKALNFITIPPGHVFAFLNISVVRNSSCSAGSAPTYAWKIEYDYGIPFVCAIQCCF